MALDQKTSDIDRRYDHYQPASLLSTSQHDFLGSTTTLNARLSDLDASSIEWNTLRELAKAVQKGVGRWLPMWLDSWTETLDEEFAEVVAIAGLTMTSDSV